MKPRWQRLAAIAGLLLPFAALTAYAPPSRLEVDGWENTYLNTYPAHFAAIPKHLIIGTGCWTWTPEAYMPIGSDVAVNTQRATLQSALNTVMDGAGPDRFYGFGRPGVDFERQLISIYGAVRQGNVRSIIYINNPGSLQAFTMPETTIAVLPVLDAIEREYPDLAADAVVYRSHLLASAGHKRNLADRAAKPAWQLWQKRVKDWGWGLAQRWYGIVDGFAFTALPQQRETQGVDAMFREVKANYNNPAACTIRGRGLMDTKLYWAGSGGDEVWQAWLRIAAGLAKARGVAFVYYVPPHLNVPLDRYNAEFKPAFVDRVRTQLEGAGPAAKPHSATIVGHAVGHGLSACDQVYDTEHHFSAGYLLNFAGKLKQARLLLADLAKAGTVAASPEAFAEPSRLERQIPDIKAEPQVLSAEESEKVREDLFRYGDWKLSRPASEAVQ